jgi:hypothetical protein
MVVKSTTLLRNAVDYSCRGDLDALSKIAKSKHPKFASLWKQKANGSKMANQPVG